MGGAWGEALLGALRGWGPAPWVVALVCGLAGGAVLASGASLFRSSSKRGALSRVGRPGTP